MTEDVTITDAHAQSAVFSPIAVIHHTGIVTGGNDTRGHYRADVRSPVTDEWFQTSDDQLPVEIPSPSSQCYITIYKKKSSLQVQEYHLLYQFISYQIIFRLIEKELS